jgi:hypothetical protein
MLRRRLFVPFCLVFTLAGTHLSHAQALPELLPFEHHVRTTDPHLRALVRHGVDTSATFAEIVTHLTQTDVLVYVEQARFANPQLDGQLTFVVSTGGVRYLRIQIGWARPPRQQLAALAHELRHAIEVAGAPAIIDDQSLAEEYGRLGIEKSQHVGRRQFETGAAIEAGRRVWREYVESPAY